MCRQQVSQFVRVNSSQDPAAADACAVSHLSVSLAASSRAAASSALQYTRLPCHALLETVRVGRRQRLGPAGRLVRAAAAAQQHSVDV